MARESTIPLAVQESCKWLLTRGLKIVGEVIDWKWPWQMVGDDDAVRAGWVHEGGAFVLGMG